MAKMDEAAARAVPGLRGFYHDGYNYGTKNPPKNTRYGCIKTNCRAKLYINENHDLESIQLLEPHTCLKSTHESIDRKVVRQLCKNAVASGCETAPRKIFDQVCDENPKIATSTSFKTVQKTIQRGKNTPNSVSGIKSKYNSIEDFAKHLEGNPRLLIRKVKETESTISAYLITSSSKTHHLIIYDENLLNELNNENDMYIDSTFRSAPDIKGIKQVLTVMCKKHNIVVPCVWVFMSRRTTLAYNSIWSHIKEKFPHFQPKRANCDFEKGEIRSLRESFLGIRVRGCYFHFCQAIVRKAKSKEYSLFLRKDNAKLNPKGHEVIKKIILIALLPPDKITEAIEIIKMIIEKHFKDNAKTLKKWKKFINFYIQNEWIKKVTPKVFSVFNVVDRTNNFLESYHRSINEIMRSNPTVSFYMQSLIKIKDRAILDLERGRKKLEILTQKLQTRLRDDAIRTAWMEISSDPPWSVEKFLNELSGYEDEAIFEQIEQNDELMEEEEVYEEIDDSDDEDEEMDFEDFMYDSCENLSIVDDTVEEAVKVTVEEESNVQSKKKEKGEKSQIKKTKTEKKSRKNKTKTEKKSRKTKTEIEEERPLPAKRIAKKKQNSDFAYF